MKDRVPTRPGRMKITPEDGSPAYYATVEMADEPSEVGTPLNKASLLQDATAALFGLGADAVPDDLFKEIIKRQNYPHYELIQDGIVTASSPIILSFNTQPKNPLRLVVSAKPESGKGSAGVTLTFNNSASSGSTSNKISNLDTGNVDFAVNVGERSISVVDEILVLDFLPRLNDRAGILNFGVHYSFSGGARYFAWNGDGEIFPEITITRNSITDVYIALLEFVGGWSE